MKHLKADAIKISYEASLLDEQNHITPYVAQLIDRLYYDIPKGRESTLKKLVKYTAQFPKVPVFKNYLMIFYQQKGNIQKVEEINEKILKEHPDYLFGKINHASNLLENKDYEQALSVLGESLLLHELYPERDVFAKDEIISYYAITIRYLYLTDNAEEADNRLDILEDIDENHQKVIQAQHFKQEHFFNKMILNIENNKKNTISVKVKDRKNHLQTTIPPNFQYPELIHYLYTNTLDSITENQLNELLVLDHDILVQDLIKVLYDSIYRYDYFTENYQDESETYFPMHAFNFLLFLKDDKALDVVMEMLRQDPDYVDFWFGDTFQEYTASLLYHISKNHKDQLIAFIKEPYIDCYCKSAVLEAFLKIYAFDNTQNKEDSIVYLEDILDFLIANHDNPAIVDTELTGLFIADLMDFGALALWPKIEKMFQLGIVGVHICGAYKDVENNMKDHVTLLEPIDDFNTIEEVYSHFSFEPDLSEGFFNKNFSDDYYKPSKPMVSEIKLGRNEPCYCGSGKKYKKCCLKQ